MNKRIAAAVTALVLAASAGGQVLPAAVCGSSVIAASADEYQGFVYEENGGMVLIQGYSGSETEITVPSEINGCPVVRIAGSAFANNTALKKVKISEGIMGIGDSAFEGCTGLTEIELPDTLTGIGYWAFLSCISLESIELPDSLESLSPYAFDSCSKLKSIKIPERVWTVDPKVFNRCLSLTEIIITAEGRNDYTVDGALYHRTQSSDGTEAVAVLTKCPNGKTELKVGENVSRIESEAVRDCPELSAVTLPEGLESIGKYGFYNCPKLKTLTVPRSVKELGDMSVGYSFDSDTSVPVKTEGFLLYCYTDSAAHMYAEKNGINYVLLDAVSIKGSVAVRYDKDTDVGEAVVEYTDSEGASSEEEVRGDGGFSIPELAQGEYTVTAKLDGFLGSSVSVTVGGGEPAEAELELYHLGDVNRDGKVNMHDYSELQRSLNGYGNEIDSGLADMNRDGAVTMRDYAALQRFLNGYT